MCIRDRLITVCALALSFLNFPALDVLLSLFNKKFYGFLVSSILLLNYYQRSGVSRSRYVSLTFTLSLIASNYSTVLTTLRVTIFEIRLRVTLLKYRLQKALKKAKKYIQHISATFLKKIRSCYTFSDGVLFSCISCRFTYLTRPTWRVSNS